ncbi:hypothetical protein L9F63_008417, partial [Diploptera punctata]
GINAIYPPRAQPEAELHEIQQTRIPLQPSLKMLGVLFMILELIWWSSSFNTFFVEDCSVFWVEFLTKLSAVTGTVFPHLFIAEMLGVKYISVLPNKFIHWTRLARLRCLNLSEVLPIWIFSERGRFMYARCIAPSKAVIGCVADIYSHATISLLFRIGAFFSLYPPTEKFYAVLDSDPGFFR